MLPVCYSFCLRISRISPHHFVFLLFPPNFNFTFHYVLILVEISVTKFKGILLWFSQNWWGKCILYKEQYNQAAFGQFHCNYKAFKNIIKAKRNHFYSLMNMFTVKGRHTYIHCIYFKAKAQYAL